MQPDSSVAGILCAAGVVLIMASSIPAAAPRYLQPGAGPSIDPFQSALEGATTSRLSTGDRYLGREANADVAPPLVHADRRVFLWGHGEIEQIQYPLADSPVDRAPDEPQILSPHTIDDLDCDQMPPRLACNDTRLGFTSVIGSGDTLGITTLNVGTIIESARIPGCSLRPLLGLHTLTGPLNTDLPGQVYDVSLEARSYIPLGDRWLGEFALAPGIFSDFQNTDDAFRLVARAVGYYKCSETLRLAMGATYLDRQDITWLPIGGLIWVPSEDWRYELMFPQPRITHRYWAESDRERWVYIRGELGGGSWSIERPSGTADIATYRDYRLLLGVEFTRNEGHSWLVEAGYAFGRELEYQSGLTDFAPDATAVVRAALTF